MNLKTQKKNTIEINEQPSKDETSGIPLFFFFFALLIIYVYIFIKTFFFFVFLCFLIKSLHVLHNGRGIHIN